MVFGLNVPHETLRCKCGREVRFGARNCYGCHAEYMRWWRSVNRPTDIQRMKSNARRYVNVYIARGKVVRGVCEVCGSPDVQPHHEDYSKPLEVVWLCRKHHLELEGKHERKKIRNGD